MTLFFGPACVHLGLIRRAGVVLGAIARSSCLQRTVLVAVLPAGRMPSIHSNLVRVEKFKGEKEGLTAYCCRNQQKDSGGYTSLENCSLSRACLAHLQSIKPPGISG
jgi:hypothetical protein